VLLYFQFNGAIHYTNTSAYNVGIGNSAGSIEWGGGGQSSFSRSYYFAKTASFK
jgi:hypothetical protein